ncbi:protease B nonderepressible form [Lunasporangiospora selenospora]|uniref:Protein PBN1 n=1 Tax=Lunasporangiospora selenospora TaxID=979761 RepID=A0A9P6FZE9_9FUNG|nr:protease B nonderepressible form [Lunasporangiospora selenospora]
MLTPPFSGLALCAALGLSVLTLAPAAAAAADEPASSSIPHSLHHRHSFFSTQPIEPTDDNFQTSLHKVKVVGFSGWHEWEVKGPLQDRSIDKFKWASQRSDKIHIQWYDNTASLLRPPFSPSFVPGLHVAITSDILAFAWVEFCPIVSKLTGGIDCGGSNNQRNTNGRDHNDDVRIQDMTSVYHHYYAHKAKTPSGFLSETSLLSCLIAKHQSQQTGQEAVKPALIDLVLQDSKMTLKVIWPVNSRGTQATEKNQNTDTIEIVFNEETDKVVEVGWFYREVTERENLEYDYFLGATVRLEAEGETVNEALVQSRSPVFPPHRRDSSTGAIRKAGHGYSTIMSPAQTFHPHAITTIHSDPYITPTTNGCDLYVLHVLPAGIFVDPFQLKGLAPEIGESTVFGETDLEKPVGVVDRWGSIVLVKAQPEDSLATSRWIPTDKPNIEGGKESSESTETEATSPYVSTIDIPMHMRYQPPVAGNDSATHVEVPLPWPVVAWGCPVDQKTLEARAAKKLFDIPVLPLSLLFSKTEQGGDVTDSIEFRYILPDPIPAQFPETYVSVPVGRLEDLEVVRTATLVLAAAGTIAVTLALIKSVLGRETRKEKQD